MGYVRLVLVHLLYTLVLCQSKSDPEERDSGLTKSRGVLSDLPPCETDGQKILHHDKSCVYIVPKSDNANEGNVEDSGAQPGQPEGGGGTRGGAGDVTGAKDKKRNDDPYDREGKYWLVPPFLIGAFSVIILYFIVHCLYLQCYVKRKIGRMARQNTSAPAIIFGDGPSTSSVFTPVVKYDGSYGKSEVMDTPVVFYQPSDARDNIPSEPGSRRSSRKSSFLQLPNFLNRRLSRQSVCSANIPMDAMPSGSGADGSEESAENKPNLNKHRASFCLVPVCRTVSDPTGGAAPQEIQGYVPSVLLPSNASFASINNKEDMPPRSPIIFVANPSLQEMEGSVPKTESEPTLSAEGRPKQQRKTSFREAEGGSFVINITPPKEEDEEEQDAETDPINLNVY